MKKFLIGSTLMLAALAASPAFAATHHSRMSASQYPEAYDANASADRDLTVSGPAIYSVDGQYAGWDPDPNIRFQLMRDQGVEGN